MTTLKEKRRKWLDNYFAPYKGLREEMEERIQELAGRGYGIANIYNRVRKLDKFESYPDHTILRFAISAYESHNNKVISRRMEQYHFNRLLGPEYDKAEKRAILNGTHGY